MDVVPRIVLPCLAALAALGAPRAATAYTCTAVNDSAGRPVNPAVTQVWNQRCIPYFINRNNLLFADGANRLTVPQSFTVWSGNPCTDITFDDLGDTAQKVEFDPAQSGNQNVITSIEDQGEVPTYFPDPDMVAITITAFSTDSGEIFDADIAINGANFAFEDVLDENACRLQPNPPFDLRSILIHEIGHFIGFDHSPDVESTMYFQAPACETKKRTLTGDDLAGVCAVYPAGLPPNTCAPPSIEYDSVAGADRFRDQCSRRLASASGCTGFAPGDATPVAGLVLAGLLFARRRRR